jgi:hypothetical protein
MADIIVLTTSQLAIVLDSLSVLFLIIGIFFLYECREKVLGTIKKAFAYFIASFTTMIILKGLVILSNLENLGSFSYDSFIVIPIILFFMGIISFYKSITNVPAPRHYKRKIDHRRRRHHRRR